MKKRVTIVLKLTREVETQGLYDVAAQWRAIRQATDALVHAGWHEPELVLSDAEDLLAPPVEAVATA